MGADGWNYFVPYQPDIEAALQALRQREFTAGHYNFRNPSQYSEISFEEWVENPDMTIDDYDEDELAEMRADYDRARAFTTPASIEDLLWYNGAEGTGSILDIERTAIEPVFATVAPLTSAQLVALFGTDRPTHMQIDQDLYDLDQFLSDNGRTRGEGTYIVLYRDGAPDEIYFTGYSGD